MAEAWDRGLLSDDSTIWMIATLKGDEISHPRCPKDMQSILRDMQDNNTLSLEQHLSAELKGGIYWETVPGKAVHFFEQCLFTGDDASDDTDDENEDDEEVEEEEWEEYGGKSDTHNDCDAQTYYKDFGDFAQSVTEFRDEEDE